MCQHFNKVYVSQLLIQIPPKGTPAVTWSWEKKPFGGFLTPFFRKAHAVWMIGY